MLRLVTTMARAALYDSSDPVVKHNDPATTTFILPKTEAPGLLLNKKEIHFLLSAGKKCCFQYKHHASGISLSADGWSCLEGRFALRLKSGFGPPRENRVQMD